MFISKAHKCCISYIDNINRKQHEIMNNRKTYTCIPIKLAEPRPYQARKVSCHVHVLRVSILPLFP